ncbi:MAG: C39 family peptidase [Lachnospiraceae bacterium]|nr:C39 family peptidase [Lachnospiraceae bacterium]
MNRKLKIVLRISVLFLVLIIGAKVYMDYRAIEIYKDINLDMFKNSNAPKPKGNYRILDCKNINQNDGYPTGCESVSAVILLKYYGIDIEVSEFIYNYLDISQLSEDKGRIVGPSPKEYYIGDPTSTSGYGCYAPVIINAFKKMLPSDMSYSDTSGQSLERLCNDYINNDIPVLVWATIDMKPPGEGRKWIIQSTGESFTWPAGEHCLVLVGYDDTHYYFNDPYNNNGLVAYSKETAASIYQAMGSQSVVIYPTG